ncbi:hypothetical protein KOAAANKH_00846 [Brevundimonas sp. NIBR10]|uniref:nuclear transport factor 2 family protein n=1 Tax=Brevundimonas sp. NIBR10 TaxID=3015997 RepID=UPI0022F1726E|nr:nuclear transport factor 2 family protein [Brevundimonas sp. NIBR10]WGM45981.1 hypothetical protein KOAAANKH_00846 [Brevundimonas sp. NIBR10]
MTWLREFDFTDMTVSDQTRADLNHAADAFIQAWATGDWAPFTSMFADDFVFQFPAGPHSGRRHGSEARRHMEQWSTDAAVNARIAANENLRLIDGDWLVLAMRGEGQMAGRPYRGVETVFLRMQAGRIVEYREYLSELGDLNDQRK